MLRRISPLDSVSSSTRKGKLVDRRKLEKLVADQFLQRTEDIAPQIEALRISGAILESASVFRTLPGRRS